MQTLRISLPGYDALSDNDLDHYSLFADEDNVLIKEFIRGSVNFKNDDYPSGYQIAHNLGYVPHFLVYVKDPLGFLFYGSADKWAQIGNANLSVAYFAYADDTYLYIFDGTNYTTDYVYYIFYDYQVGSSGQTITESDVALKVSKAGVNALTSVDPNDYIFHSDLNTFKIIKEDTLTINYDGSSTYTVAHGSGLADPAAYAVFIKFPDGTTSTINGTFQAVSRDRDAFANVVIDDTNFIFNLYCGTNPSTFYVKYYIFETPLV